MKSTTFNFDTLENIFESTKADLELLVLEDTDQSLGVLTFMLIVILVEDSLLWQPLFTKTNDYTSGKSLNIDIRWEFHKRTQQEVSAKLESYIYKVHMVHATTSCPPHSLLKATMLYTCALTSFF